MLPFFCLGERNSTEQVAFRCQVHDLENHYAVMYRQVLLAPPTVLSGGVYTREVLDTLGMNGDVAQKMGFCHASKARGQNM